MDAETTDAVDTLRTDINRLDTSLRSEIQDLGVSLRSEIREQGISLRSEMRELRDDTNRRFDGVTDRIDDTRRHMDVIAESLRDDIRMLAEGLVSLGAKVDASRR